MTDKATPSPASADSVMAKAMMLVGALDDSCEEATSLPFLEAVTALRAEVERLAAQSVPDLDTMRTDFHQWCATNGYKTGFVNGGECPMGRPVYEDHRTHAAWWAFQKAAKLYGAQPSQAPVVQAVQAREYPPLPWGNQQPYVWFCRTKDTDLIAAFRAYVDADRASSGATTQAVRMLTPREIELLREIRLHAQFGLNEGWQREARNLLLELEQYYRTIPPSGVIGGV